MMTDLMPGDVDAGTGNVVSGDEADLRACLGDLAGLVTGGRRLDNTLGEGPCITAALEGRTVRSGSLGREKTWPRFGPRVGRLGVHSALSLPLMLTGQVVGAINVLRARQGRLRRPRREPR